MPARRAPATRVFVVAGDQVWRLDTLQYCIGSLDQSVGMLEGNFDAPLKTVRNPGSFTGPGTPFVPLQIIFDRINCAMATIWMMGYDYLGFDRGDETNWGEYEDWGAYEEGRSPSDPSCTRPRGSNTPLQISNCMLDGQNASRITSPRQHG